MSALTKSIALGYATQYQLTLSKGIALGIPTPFSNLAPQRGSLIQPTGNAWGYDAIFTTPVWVYVMPTGNVMVKSHRQRLHDMYHAISHNAP